MVHPSASRDFSPLDTKKSYCYSYLRNIKFLVRSDLSVGAKDAEYKPSEFGFGIDKEKVSWENMLSSI